MNRVLPAIDGLVKGDDGQDLVEYGLLASLIAVVVAVGVTSVGQIIRTVFWDVIGNGF